MTIKAERNWQTLTNDLIKNDINNIILSIARYSMWEKNTEKRNNKQKKRDKNTHILKNKLFKTTTKYFVFYSCSILKEVIIPHVFRQDWTTMTFKHSASKTVHCNHNNNMKIWINNKPGTVPLKRTNCKMAIEPEDSCEVLSPLQYWR